VPDPGPTERAMARANSDWARYASDPWLMVKDQIIITQDEHPDTGVEVERPMPATSDLESVYRLMKAEPRGLMCKTRQLMVTWIAAFILLTDAIFHDGRHNIAQGKRLDDVKAQGDKGLMGRMRFMRKRLPDYLKPQITSQDTTTESYSNGSTIEVIPEGGAIIRSRVPSMMVMDELAFHESGEENWNSANPAAAWLWGVTTPNGHEFIYRQADTGKPWDEWRSWPEIARGLHGYRNRSGVMLAFFDWSSLEERCTPEADAKRRRGYTNINQFMREQMGDFSLHEGLGVFANEFKKDTHVIPHYTVDVRLPLYRGWDTGYNGQAVSFWQINHRAQLVHFDQIILKAVPLGVVAQEAIRRTMQHLSTTLQRVKEARRDEMQGLYQIVDFGDPAAEAHHASGESDVMVLMTHGIRMLSKVTTGRKGDLVEQVRSQLLYRTDGSPGMIIAKNSPEMDHVVAGYLGGYRYAKPKEGRAEKHIPHKDGFYDHIFDSVQYPIDHLRPIQPIVPEDPLDRMPTVEPGVGSDLAYGGGWAPAAEGGWPN